MSTDTNTGGPAFPYGTAYAGMTLRDYFAAKAMQAILSDGSWHGHTCKTAALESYEMADAMLKARGA